MKRDYNKFGLVFVAIIVAIAVGIVMLFSKGIGASTRFRQRDEVISTVNGVNITVGEFQDRIRAERWYQAQEIRWLYAQAQIYAGQFEGGQDPFQQQIHILIGELLYTEGFGERVLEDMELQIVLEQAAEQRGIVIDKQAVSAQLDAYTIPRAELPRTPAAYLQPSPTRPPTYPPITTPTPSPSPTLVTSLTPSPSPTLTATPLAPFEFEGTLAAFQENLYQTAESFGISLDALTDIFYLQALQAALRESRFNELIESGEIQTQSLTATTRHILIGVPGSENRYTNFDQSLCESEEWEPYRQAAEDVLTRLENGEAFEDLAVELSDDPSSASVGGFVDEVSDVDVHLVPGYAAAMHEADIGEYYGPVCSIFGFHIVQVLDKYWRDISEVQQRRDMDDYFFEWTTQLLLDATIERGEDWPQWIIGEPTLEAMLGDLYEVDGNEMRQ